MSWIFLPFTVHQLRFFSVPSGQLLKGIPLLVLWNFVGTGKLLTLPSSVVPKHMLQRCEVLSSMDPLCLNRNKKKHAGQEIQGARWVVVTVSFRKKEPEK